MATLVRVMLDTQGTGVRLILMSVLQLLVSTETVT